MIFEEYNAPTQNVPSTSTQSDSSGNEAKIDPVAEKYVNTGIKPRTAHENADSVERPVQPKATNHVQNAMQV